jgi:hypothetical protein
MSVVDPAWLFKHPFAVAKPRASKFKGYAATPGTGPAGETCKSCLHYSHNRGSEGRSRKKFPKCGLMRALWTNGPGTDIKASSPACSKFEPAGKGLDRRVIVCDACLQASCFHGLFMCDQAREAGITVKTVRELQKLNLEHSSYWKL